MKKVKTQKRNTFVRTRTTVTIKIQDTELLCKYVEQLERLNEWLGVEFEEKKEVKETDERVIISRITHIVNNWYDKPLGASDKLIRRFPELKKEGIVPMRYIQNRMSTIKVNDLKTGIDKLINTGYIRRVTEEERITLLKKYLWANIHTVQLYKRVFNLNY